MDVIIFEPPPGILEELLHNYQEMDDTGKEKLKEVMEKFQEIQNTVDKND